VSGLSSQMRVVSGMRPTGPCHLGHYQGVLKNWLKLQHEHECLFFVADWHALTTHYEDPSKVEENIWELVIDWLAVGMNPGSCKLFIQSRVPEHAELALLLGMLTPLGWLERVPTFKDQQEKLKEKDLSTYGFLGYPLLQSADILLYKTGLVPVGEDQVSHLELTREISRRFNFLYGRDAQFIEKTEAAIKRMGKKNASLYHDLLKRYQESGEDEALLIGHALIDSQGNLSLGDRERLYGYLEGSGKIIFPEPQALLSSSPKLLGLDGQKMSKSYSNTIGLREEPESVTKKIRVMPTDPARVRLRDPGDPERCPVWPLHQVYSSTEQQSWVVAGCRSAEIGCLDCKNVLIEALLMEHAPIRERAESFKSNPRLVKEIIREGCEAAREIAKETMEEVRDVIGLPSHEH
jgi:tryptophanyl-tRNA synthetase